jgi:hypothetical protein
MIELVAIPSIKVITPAVEKLNEPDAQAVPAGFDALAEK